MKKIVYSLLLISSMAFAQTEKNVGDFTKVTAFDKIDVSLVASSENKIVLTGANSQEVELVKVDDFLKDTILKPLVDFDDITSWQKNHIKAVQTSKEKKKSGETDKETDSNIAQVIDIESIMPNVTLSNSINPLYGQKFTDIELGLILKSLLEIS